VEEVGRTWFLEEVGQVRCGRLLKCDVVAWCVYYFVLLFLVLFDVIIYVCYYIDLFI
jgi:hypothetical protein